MTLSCFSAEKKGMRFGDVTACEKVVVLSVVMCLFVRLSSCLSLFVYLLSVLLYPVYGFLTCISSRRMVSCKTRL